MKPMKERPASGKGRVSKRIAAADWQAADRRREREEFLKDKALVNVDNLPGIYNPANYPDFVDRGYYVDWPFSCQDCGVLQVWTATQQKWWYETAKGSLHTVPLRCRACRRKERARKDAAREVHLKGLEAKVKPSDTPEA